MAAKKQFSGGYVSWPKPTFTSLVKTNKHYKSNFHGAMLYAHYELSAIDLKKEVVKYLKSLDPKHPMLERIKDMDENRFATFGKYMYILNHGGEIPDNISSSLMSSFERSVSEEETKIAAAKKAQQLLEEKTKSNTNANTGPKVVITIQDRLREKAREVAGEIEGWIDDFCMDKKSAAKTLEDFVNLFKANDLKAPHMRHLLNIFERRCAEINEAASGTNKELTEAYSNFTKPELKKFALFHTNLLKACEMMQEVAKVVRAPRKPKPVSQDKLVAGLKFKKEDAALGIVSINPLQILGAKDVWVYNTKTKKIAHYKAADDTGLSVKGASITNFSADSVEKTLRKPVEALAEFKKASKVKLRTFLKDIQTVDVKPGGKLNEHHIILRADK